jgi:hypothetical protein
MASDMFVGSSVVVIGVLAIFWLGLLTRMARLR